MRQLLFVSITAVSLALLWWLFVRAAKQRRSAARIVTTHAPEVRPSDGARARGPLAHWLELAGLRSRAAPAVFILSTLCGIVLGAVIVHLLTRSAVFERASEWLEKMPGGIGGVFEPVLYIGPWFCFVILASAPTLYVRAQRRKRVSDIERNLPIVLDLLATLAESGLSFDASMARILEAQPAERPLGQELRTFQLEVLAGTGRIECLRRLARRIAVPAVSIFVSALVQAEQVGAGLADVLRRQADDLRSRRSERAMVTAQALPVKLVFPLILCFLPMIFASTLGPAFHQFFQIVQNVTRNLR